MIETIPSISVMSGKVARTVQGDYSALTTYKESPLVFAQQFQDHGITKIHLIDLDGSKRGNVDNFDVLSLITGHTDLDVDFGGGISTDGDLQKAFEFGAKRVTVGSLAIYNQDLFSSWLISYGRNKLTLSADFQGDSILVKGMQKTSETKLLDLLDYYYLRSVQYVKCADVSRDGTMEGPDLQMYKKIIDRYPQIKVLASGGLRNIDDFKRLEDIGVYGVIFGKAFYEGRITLQDLDSYIGANKS